MKEREFSRGTILVRRQLALTALIGSWPKSANKPRRVITDAVRRRLLSQNGIFSAATCFLRRVQYYSTAGLPPPPAL